MGEMVTKAMVMKTVHGLIKALAPEIAGIKKRLQQLEQAAGIDAEVCDTLADLAKRLEEVEDHTWKHRGYWREGMTAKRNEVVAHDGGSWLCNRNTKESPSTQSADWTRLARPGRDGRDAR